MGKIVLSLIAALSISALSTSAGEIKLYQNANGQVFTTPATDRTDIDMISLSGAKKSITIVDNKSPDFLLGKQTHINMKFIADDNSDMWLKAGVRIQGTFENVSTNYKSDVNKDTSILDAYLRRVRFEVSAGFNKWTSFVMDIRNDKANFEDKGEQSFNVGDAYVKIKKPFNTSLVNFKLYRAKIDISRSETVKSARVIAYDRPKVADEAAQYITHNRRGTNIQAYGDWEKKIHYQIATGDGVYSGKMKDAAGAKLSKQTKDDVTQNSFFYGGKIVLSPFDGWEETKRTETYFAQGKHFEIGAAYWASDHINYDDGTAVPQKIDHTLTNLEMSAHYKGLFVQAEYFQFDGVVKAWRSTEIGKSSGWYITSEYVIEELNYLAPFVRYESWDKFKGADGYDYTATTAGVNWYLKGNSIKAGLVYQTENYGTELDQGERTVSTVRLTSQFFF